MPIQRKTERVSISLDPEVYERALAKSRAMGFENSFSAYVQMLIKREIGGVSPSPQVMHEAEPPPYKAGKQAGKQKNN